MQPPTGRPEAKAAPMVVHDGSAPNGNGAAAPAHAAQDADTATVEIGARCCVGGNSLVLYDTQMEDRATLDNLSLLMKGEVLPADTYWRGIPARRAGEG